MAKAFVLPFVLYLLGTNLAGRLDPDWYPVGYAAVVAVVLIASAIFLKGMRAIRPHWRIGPGILVGVVGILLWIVLSHLQVEQLLVGVLPSWLLPGPRVGFNPFEELSGNLSVWGFIAIRLVGIAIAVPLAEELFWRGFLLRWLIDPDWEKVSLGDYTAASCWMVVLMFTLAHPEWLAAATYCLLINGLLYWKRDLWLCIVAHSVSNLLLAVYVLQTNNWWLW